MNLLRLITCVKLSYTVIMLEQLIAQTVMRTLSQIDKFFLLAFIASLASCAKEESEGNGKGGLVPSETRAEKWEVVYEDDHKWVLARLNSEVAQTTTELLAFDFGNSQVPQDLPDNIIRLEILDDGGRVKLWEEPGEAYSHEISTQGASPSTKRGEFFEVVGISNLSSPGWELVESNINGLQRKRLPSTPFIQMKACPSGGAGSTACSSSSGGWSCSVSCGSGWYSCCGSGINCFCIKNGNPEPK